jgi:hypothetical protein
MRASRYTGLTSCSSGISGLEVLGLAAIDLPLTSCGPLSAQGTQQPQSASVQATQRRQARSRKFRQFGRQKFRPWPELGSRTSGQAARPARKFPLSGWPKFRLPPGLWPKASGKFGPSGQTSGQPEGLNNPARDASSRFEKGAPHKPLPEPRAAKTVHTGGPCLYIVAQYLTRPLGMSNASKS